MDKKKYFEIISNIQNIQKGYEIEFLESEMKMAERDFCCKPQTFIRELTQAIDERKRDIMLDAEKRISEAKHNIDAAGNGYLNGNNEFHYHAGQYDRDVRYTDETGDHIRKAISLDEFNKRETERRISSWKSYIERENNDALKSIMVLNNYQSKVDELQDHSKPDSSAKDNEVEKYEVDTRLVHVIFNFCDERNVLKDEITEIQLINRFGQANFGGDICTKGNKLKIQIIIHAVVTEEMMGAKTNDWYKDAVDSLGITKAECSRNHSPEFKEELIDTIKEYKKGR